MTGAPSLSIPNEAELRGQIAEIGARMIERQRAIAEAYRRGLEEGRREGEREGVERTAAEIRRLLRSLAGRGERREASRVEALARQARESETQGATR